MKKYLCFILTILSFSVFAQLRASNTDTFFSVKGTFNSEKTEIIKNTIEKELATPTIENNDFVWSGRGSFEIILNKNFLKIEIQKSNDNQEIVMKIKNLGEKIMAIKNINKVNS